jgi:hypothetical protein
LYYHAGLSASTVNLYRKATNLCKADPPLRDRVGLAARSSATHAVISYTAPSTAACTVAVSTAPFPMAHVSTLHADTPAPALDSRAGSVSDGLRRQFVVGTVSALTPSTRYNARVDCGGWAFVVPFSTRAAGAGGAEISGAAATAETSTSADMSAPTALPSATTHRVTVPSGVLYFRRSGEPVQVVL